MTMLEKMEEAANERRKQSRRVYYALAAFGGVAVLGGVALLVTIVAVGWKYIMS